MAEKMDLHNRNTQSSGTTADHDHEEVKHFSMHDTHLLPMSLDEITRSEHNKKPTREETHSRESSEKESTLENNDKRKKEKLLLSLIQDLQNIPEEKELLLSLMQNLKNMQDSAENIKNNVSIGELPLIHHDLSKTVETFSNVIEPENIKKV